MPGDGQRKQGQKPHRRRSMSSSFWEGEGGGLMDGWAKKVEEMQRRATEKLQKKAAEVQKMTEMTSAWSLFDTQNLPAPQSDGATRQAGLAPAVNAAGAAPALPPLALACAAVAPNAPHCDTRCSCWQLHKHKMRGLCARTRPARCCLPALQ